jgi:hypothetical protein
MRVIWHNDCVRRMLAIPLLIVFMLPFTLPLFGANAAQAEVPACCRRNGKHHCMMRLDDSQGTSMRTIGEKCPYSVAPPAILVLPSFAPSISASIFAGVMRHPAAAPQTEAQQRISFDRSRQKRGPPAQTA